MKILAVDTASKSCSAAVVCQDRILAESLLSIDETHSKTIPGLIERVLKSSGISIKDVDAYAVTRGPGSFTGLRIGISIVKGMAAADNKPIAGVSALDALAIQFCFSSMLICPMLDAKRNEVYFAKYRFGELGEMEKETLDSVMTPDNVIADIDGPCLFVGDGSVVYHDFLAEKMGDLAVFAPTFANTVRASYAGYLAITKIMNNEVYTAKSLEPLYLRKSDAEIKKS